jgi:hypothetical protein
MRYPFRRPSRRQLVVAGGLVLAALVCACAFGPVVRAQVAQEATRRHLEVEVRAVRPAWFAVRLVGVTVRPEGVDALGAKLDEVRVSLTGSLRVEQIELRGGEINVHGDLEHVREELQRWRAGRGEPGAGTERVAGVTGEALSLRWDDDMSQAPRADVHGLGFNRDAQGVRLGVSDGHFQLSGVQVGVVDASLQLDPGGGLTRAHAAGLVLEMGARTGSKPLEAPPPPVSATPDPPSLVLAVRTTQPRSRSGPTAPQDPDPGAPFVSLPDLHGVRARAAAIAALLAQHVPEGAEVSVDAMTWKIAQEEERVAFTIGPGPLTVDRTPARFELRFSTDTRAATTSLSIRALLPTDGGDVSVTLEGGPVSLSLLGLQEGAAGLVDVEHATVTGRARVTLAGDASGLTFDGEGGTRGLSVRDPKLATEIVRDIDLELRARGALTATGELRVDDFAATLGALHVAGSGSLDQKPDHVAAAFRFELPSATCQTLLDSVPTALLPVLQSTKIAGTFGARGRIAFDTRRLDDLELEYDIQDQCRVVEVPPTLARERFRQPFVHRIYLPDGSTTEQTIGPGTPSWSYLGQISPYMQVAVLTTEDGGFPRHHGFNQSAIRASIVANLKARRFVRGASTITMQLAKNLFLARDKNLSRKLEEVVLTDYLEQTFSKDELMELYLNVIEFGPAVYGITSASEYYFGRRPAELDLAESLFLSSILPAPLRLGAMRASDHASDGWMHTIRNLMQIANKRGLVTDAELAEGAEEPILFWHGGSRPVPRPPVRARSRFDGDDADAAPASDVPPGDAP